jgi:hypothetical protein
VNAPLVSLQSRNAKSEVIFKQLVLEIDLCSQNLIRKSTGVAISYVLMEPVLEKAVINGGFGVLFVIVFDNRSPRL